MVYTLYTINKAYEVTSGHHYSQSFINMPNTFTIIKNTLESTLLDKIKLALSIKSMTNEKLNNTETLKIDFNYPINSSEYLTETVWYDINTLYPIKVISNLHPQNATYKITSCPLSEEELVFTNKECYKEIIKSENDSNN